MTGNRKTSQNVQVRLLVCSLVFSDARDMAAERIATQAALAVVDTLDDLLSEAQGRRVLREPPGTGG